MVSMGNDRKEGLMSHMPILGALTSKYKINQPLAGKTILVCTHATTATMRLISTIVQIGASVIYVPISYSTNEQMLKNIGTVPNVKIIKKAADEIRKIAAYVDVIFEDGMRISELIYKHPTQYNLKKHLYGIEQTTSGIRMLENIAKHELLYPVINVAESEIKLEVENFMATPESILALFVTDGQCTLSQKNILVLGYGSVGRGVSMICCAHGAKVTVVEINPIKRVLALSRGHVTIDISDMNGVLKDQDIIISCTSNRAGLCLGPEQFMLMKNGAKIVNAGSGAGEVSPDALKPESYTKNRAAASITEVNGHISCVLEKNDMTKTIEIICSANPLNLGCGDGTADEIMDFVFSLVLVILINVNGSNITRTINPVDPDMARQIATMWLPDLYDVKLNHIKSAELVDEHRPWGKLTRFFSYENGANLDRFSIVRASFEQNTSTDGHYHAVSEEAYFVESGTEDISTWDPKNPDATHRVFNLNPGDYLSIPKGRAHRVFAGAMEKFVCLVIASPPFSFWDQFFPIHPPPALQPFSAQAFP